MLRSALAGGALALALTAAGCTSDQEQQTLNGLNIACAGLAVGTTIAVQVAATIPGAAPAATIAGTVGSASGAACTGLLPLVKDAIDNVTATGQTAVVTASATSPTGVKMVRRLRVTPAGQVIFSGNVAPNGFPF